LPPRSRRLAQKPQALSSVSTLPGWSSPLPIGSGGFPIVLTLIAPAARRGPSTLIRVEVGPAQSRYRIEAPPSPGRDRASDVLRLPRPERNKRHQPGDGRRWPQPRSLIDGDEVEARSHSRRARAESGLLACRDNEDFGSRAEFAETPLGGAPPYSS